MDKTDRKINSSIDRCVQMEKINRKIDSSIDRLIDSKRGGGIEARSGIDYLFGGLAIYKSNLQTFTSRESAKLKKDFGMVGI